ncbi:sulfite oxidase-like [Lytechinus variegatus]|uniref:sulfite oxidase-like n=1 Tax=Lytechinus variegatus TaxID=7654 RepID=UPI001BB13EFA|nr:sulfite oxidase-like [Lytechinus variegatus]XP_041458391.1 sulfite oxidase-like [Lytechinus variegatus]
MASYNNEPARNPNMTINCKEPFNAEPPTDVLREHFVTPNDQFYIRNHAPVPSLDGRTHRVTVDGLVPRPLELTAEQLRTWFPQATVMATLMCAGNRRTEMSSIKQVKGVVWGHAAVSNAIWRGPRLRDVLLMAGIEKLESRWEDLHVDFEGVDICKEDRGYGSSIPLLKALDPRGDVIVALEMNGSELPRDHGYPMRIVAPGIVGARSVKWLKSIRVLGHESTNYYQKRDYKLFLPHIDWDTVDDWWEKSPSIQELPVQAAAIRPQQGESITPGTPYTIKGYALSGGGRRIIRVDVSLDGGKRWDIARLFTKVNENQTKANTKWSWEFWEYPVQSFPSPCEVVVRAWDDASNTMPDDMSSIWNLRGVLNNSWVRIKVPAKAKF